MSSWTPRNQYEVAPGLWIGSEIGDIDREVKQFEAADKIRDHLVAHGIQISDTKVAT